MSEGYVLVNLSLRRANEWVERYHRKLGAVRGMKFAIGAERGGGIGGCRDRR